jgi:hypothetical protein
MVPLLLHLATFGDHGAYVGTGDNRTVKCGSHWCDTAGLRAKASLLWLPLLEHDYQMVREALLAGLTHADLEQAV